MHDISLSELLSARGFVGENEIRALESLYRAKLTRPGKVRIAVNKITAVDEVLGAAFVRHCRKTDCKPSCSDARHPVRVSAQQCESCGGSDNRRAVEEMVAAMETAGWTKLLVAGGSPGTRDDLQKLCEGRLNLRFVTEDTAPNKKTIGGMLGWSDIAVIWTSTEISHKATDALRGAKVLRVPRRGVAALANAVRDRCIRVSLAQSAEAP